VHATLDAVGVAGFTEFQKVTGRGPRGQHFDTHVWPGYDGLIQCVVDAERSEQVVQALADLNRTMEQSSRGSRGLHVFTWGCQQRF
jgi:nitrogen regulatory protein PII